MRSETLRLKDGLQVTGEAFGYNDFLKIQKIFSQWLGINRDLKSLGGRALNIPDVFSEAIFCLAFDAVRTNNTAFSYDCVLRSTGEGVQIKSASIKNDLTSFGPNSIWDLLYFADFIPNNEVNGEVWFYKIDDAWIYPLVLNKSKGETFRMQQEQGRRPRFSIQQSIIRKNGLKPQKKINIVSGDGLTF